MNQQRRRPWCWWPTMMTTRCAGELLQARRLQGREARNGAHRIARPRDEEVRTVRLVLDLTCRVAAGNSAAHGSCRLRGRARGGHLRGGRGRCRRAGSRRSSTSEAFEVETLLVYPRAPASHDSRLLFGTIEGQRRGWLDAGTRRHSRQQSHSRGRRLARIRGAARQVLRAATRRCAAAHTSPRLVVLLWDSGSPCCSATPRQREATRSPTTRMVVPFRGTDFPTKNAVIADAAVSPRHPLDHSTSS